MAEFDFKKLIELPPPMKLLSVVTSELIATALLIFFGCLTVIGDRDLVQISLGWGFIVGQIVMVFGPNSGAHCNPGITTSAAILGSISPLLALIYFVCQFTGSILGTAVLKSVVSHDIWKSSNVMYGNGSFGGTCVTVPNNVKPWQAVALEFIATSFLILAVCHAHDPRSEPHKDSFPLKVAGVIIADVICVAPFTGASLNTARTFGPAIIENFWVNHWVYWAGPWLAGFIVPTLYWLIWMPPKKDGDDLDPKMVNQLFGALRKTDPPESS